MTIEEFMRDYPEEAEEYIVRIFWTEDGKSSQMIGNCRHDKARFDEAIKVSTGEKIRPQLFQWLHWLTPKKLFGFHDPYQFEKGHLYRVLLRKRPEQEGERFTAYYVEKLLEADVNEPRLDPVQEFESQYSPETCEKLVLIKKPVNAWAVVYGHKRANASILASADPDGSCLDQTYGVLSWMEKDTGSLKTNFGALEICKVRVRPSLTRENCYLLVKVLGKAHDSQLAQIAEDYKKPVVLNTEFGEFILNRDYNWFEGSVDYPGGTATVYLDTEEGVTDASAQLAKLRELMQDPEDTDKKVRNYAADEMADLLADWCDEEVTRDQFMERIGTPLITIAMDGSVEYSFNDDDMFAGHTIVIDTDAEGNFTGADIEG